MSLVSAIIVAGGKGLRMNLDIRKQYLKLGGLSILSHTLLAVDACPLVSKIYLVVPEEDRNLCKETILAPMQLRSPTYLVPGGEIRQKSVYNGLASIPEQDGLVLIHDGVRPFVAVEKMIQCIKVAETCGACILGIPVKDTLKRCDNLGNIEKTIDRNALWLAQTPQAFQFHLIKKAHDFAMSENFTGTDDASLLEFMGARVHIIPGSIFNIKITTPGDYSMAQALLSVNRSENIT
jgi:2-C-methyl-D-erythritol 4-phosphate cytidylyltransferase